MNMKIADPFYIIAHRGVSAYAPENTMAAFKLADEMGIDRVETDVGFTKDCQLILFHDNTLDRTTNGTGPSEEMTLAELKQLDAGSWGSNPIPAGSSEPRVAWNRDYSGERLITLPELLDAFGPRFIYHIEIKRPAPGLVPAVIHAVQERDLVNHVYISSINDLDSLLEAKRIEPSIRTDWSPVNRLKENGPDTVREAASHRITLFTFNSGNLDAELVKLANELGMETRSSGIKNRQHMIEAVEAGCNGMTINWPDWLMEYVRELQGA
jgi:glycerophosphoryl diester phosphodiesterase